jgi:hypothetical protein
VLIRNICSRKKKKSRTEEERAIAHEEAQRAIRAPFSFSEPPGRKL